MIIELVVVGGVAGILGYSLAMTIYKKTKVLDKYKERKINKVLNDPHELKRKLEQSGEIVDLGEKVIYEVVTNEEGKEVLEVRREKIDAPMDLKVSETIGEIDNNLENIDLIDEVDATSEKIKKVKAVKKKAKRKKK